MTKKTSLATGLLALTIAFAAFLFLDKKNEKSPAQNPNVKIMRAQTQTGTESINISGFVRANNHADIAPMVSGRIVKIYKHEGDFVQKGQLIANIDSQQADAQTLAAQTNVDTLKKTLTESEKYYDQLVHQTKESGNDDQAIKSAKKARDLQIQNVQAQLVSAQGYLTIAEAGRKNFNITAPFSGKITSVFLKEGGFANFSAPLFSISSSDGLEIEAYVPASNGQKINLGSAVEFYINNEKPTLGNIINISPNADPQTLKTLVRIKINDESNSVRLGDFIHGEILIPTDEKVIPVPRNAIVLKGGDQTIFTVDENNVAHEKNVQTSQEQNGTVYITKGLEDGENIIIQGQQFLINGLIVSPYENK